MQYTWTCACCSRSFDTLPLSYGARSPMPWYSLPEAERSQRAELTSDWCVVDGREFYIRGCVEIPVHGLEEPFVWGCWADVSGQNFQRIMELRGKPVPDGEPPCFGWFCDWLKGYPDPEGVKCRLHLRTMLRPYIEMEPTDYPLAVQQREGVTVEWVKATAALMHGGSEQV